jgi:hypothetical protein
LSDLLTDADLPEIIADMDYQQSDEIITELPLESINDIGDDPVPYGEYVPSTEQPPDQTAQEFLAELRAAYPDLGPGELPPGFTAVRLQDGSEGDDIIYIIYDADGNPIGYVVVPYGMVLGMLYIFDAIVLFNRVNPQTSAHDMGLQPILWHAALVSFFVVAFIFKIIRRRKIAA